MWYYYNIVLCEYKDNYMKKAFTLSEALVTLAIIGVLAAILIPVINNVKPDKDRITYKKALYSMQNALSNAMDSNVYNVAANSAAFWKDEAIPPESFCQSIADALNTSGAIKCTAGELAGPSSYSNPNFITTDGIRFWGLEGSFPENSDTRTIYVDRGLGQKELQTIAAKRYRNPSGDINDGLGLKIRVRYDGKVDTPDTADYEFENGLVEMSLQVTEGRRS